MSEETRPLAYRYRLRLTPAQEDAVDRAQDALRRVWNHLVRSQRFAEREWRHGRAASIKRDLVEFSVAKKATGRAMPSACKVAAERNITLAEALRANRVEFIEKLATIRKRKDGSRCLRFARRRLANAYADETVNATVDRYYPPALGALLFQAVRIKFERCSEMWLKGRFRRPRFKRKGEPVTVQMQIALGSPFKLARFVRLSGLSGQALTRCEVVVHRSLPAGAKIKQIAISGPRARRYLIVMFNAPAAEVAKDFPATHRVAGVDPGIKVGLTVAPQDSQDFGVSEGQALAPPMSRDVRFLKRLRRLQRKLDRQRRKNNPDCFDSEGRWIKGKRASVESANMKHVASRIATMNEHLAETRRDFYHNAACQILRQFDGVAVGKWRPAMTRQRKPSTPSAKGLGAARRAINRVSYDHAISLFISFLKDKAARSTTPKEVQDIHETRTTCTCPKCGKATGPSGTRDLAVREWTCPACGLRFKRDAAAAWQIANRFSTKAAASAVQSSVGSQGSTLLELQDPDGKRRRAIRRERVASAAVADEAAPARAANASATLSQKPLAASENVSGQAIGGARAAEAPVAAVDGLPSCAVDPPGTLRKQAPLAKAAGARSASTPGATGCRSG